MSNALTDGLTAAVRSPLTYYNALMRLHSTWAGGPLQGPPFLPQRGLPYLPRWHSARRLWLRPSGPGEPLCLTDGCRHGCNRFAAQVADADNSSFPTRSLGRWGVVRQGQLRQDIGALRIRGIRGRVDQQHRAPLCPALQLDPVNSGGFITPEWLAYSEVIHCRWVLGPGSSQGCPENSGLQQQQLCKLPSTLTADW